MFTFTIIAAKLNIHEQWSACVCVCGGGGELERSVEKSLSDQGWAWTQVFLHAYLTAIEFSLHDLCLDKGNMKR